MYCELHESTSTALLSTRPELGAAEHVHGYQSSTRSRVEKEWNTSHVGDAVVATWTRIARNAREEVDEWETINGTVVNHWSRTQATRALSKAEAEILRIHHRSSSASRDAVDDNRHGTKCGGPCLDGRQRSQVDCVKKRPWEDQTCGIWDAGDHRLREE